MVERAAIASSVYSVIALWGNVATPSSLKAWRASETGALASGSGDGRRARRRETGPVCRRSWRGPATVGRRRGGQPVSDARGFNPISSHSRAVVRRATPGLYPRRCRWPHSLRRKVS